MSRINSDTLPGTNNYSEHISERNVLFEFVGAVASSKDVSFTLNILHIKHIAYKI